MFTEATRTHNGVNFIIEHNVDAAKLVDIKIINIPTNSLVSLVVNITSLTCII